jgi:enoyl-CoA hydratase/carnithine racemase
MPDAANDSPVLATVADGVLTLTLNAPRKRNALSAPGLSEGLLAGLERLDADPALRCAVITGGEGLFCSGGDLDVLRSAPRADVARMMHRNAWLYRRIAHSPKLVIAAVDGPAFGAGLGLACVCDVVVAGPQARFCCAFTRTGAMPDAALFWSLPARVGLAKARQLMLWATELDARAAADMGLADEAVATSAGQRAAELARQVASGPGLAYGRIKAGLRRGMMGLEQALEFQLDNAPGVFDSADFREGASAFLEKRSPRFGQA